MLATHRPPYEIIAVQMQVYFISLWETSFKIALSLKTSSISAWSAPAASAQGFRVSSIYYSRVNCG